MMKTILCGLWVGMVCFLAPAGAWSAEASKEEAKAKPSATAAQPRELPAIEWLTDYAEAYELAKRHNKMLFIYFEGKGANAAQNPFETVSLKDAKVRTLLQDFVTARLPAETHISVQGKDVRLLDHASFAELRKGAGIAILDFVHRDAEHFGHVVSAIPFAPGKYYKFRPEHLSVLLQLPPGTLTQRTLMFAVRIHPEGPASTKGEKDPLLTAEANSHSNYQAQIHVQGHHHWDNRFQRIRARLTGGLVPQEVVAESWPHQTLVDSAVDCVHSWRQSPGHWSAVNAAQPRYGYDMRLGSNGIWYATGIFGNRH
jgi:hypothetical protein